MSELSDAGMFACCARFARCWGSAEDSGAEEEAEMAEGGRGRPCRDALGVLQVVDVVSTSVSEGGARAFCDPELYGKAGASNPTCVWT